MDLGGAGTFEQYLQYFRTYILPLVHSSGRVEDLFRMVGPQDRLKFYEHEWNTWRWRLVFHIYFSRLAMAYAGRAPHCMDYVTGSVAGTLLRRTKKGLIALDPSDNPYLQWIVWGQHTTALPWSLRPENVEQIRMNLDRLEWHCISLEQFLHKMENGHIDRFNLSNIFEYMSPQTYHHVLERLIQAGHSGTRLAYWNLLVRRHRPDYLAHLLCPLDKLSSQLHNQAQTFFYGKFVLEEVV